MALIDLKLVEKGLLVDTERHIVNPGDIVSAGKMSVEFIYVNHSIPDSCAFAIHTPAGVIIQTGDFNAFTTSRAIASALSVISLVNVEGINK